MRYNLTNDALRWWAGNKSFIAPLWEKSRFRVNIQSPLSSRCQRTGGTCSESYNDPRTVHLCKDISIGDNMIILELELKKKKTRIFSKFCPLARDTNLLPIACAGPGLGGSKRDTVRGMTVCTYFARKKYARLVTHERAQRRVYHGHLRYPSSLYTAQLFLSAFFNIDDYYYFLTTRNPLCQSAIFFPFSSLLLLLQHWKATPPPDETWLKDYCRDGKKKNFSHWTESRVIYDGHISKGRGAFFTTSRCINCKLRHELFQYQSIEFIASRSINEIKWNVITNAAWRVRRAAQ